MKWTKRIAIVLGILLALLLALPLLISLDDYIPTIEKAASAKLGEPVSIASVRFATLPTPRVTVDGIRIGKSVDVSVGKIMLIPDIWSLFGSSKAIRSLDIEALVLTQNGLDKLPLWSKSDPNSPTTLRVENIRLNDALIKLDKSSLGPFDAHVRMAASGEPELVDFTTRDGKLKAMLRPEQANRYQLEARARSWKPPLGPPVALDEVVIKGVVSADSATLNQIDIRLYGGSVEGKAVLNWRSNLQLSGNLSVAQVELRELVPLLSPGTRLSGKLDAKTVFVASAPAADQLVKALRLETPFEVRDGVLHGFDLYSAATNLLKQGTSGGETRFNQLSGHLNLERGTYRLTQLKISSGSLAADGAVTISPRKELSGRINAKVVTSVASAGAPLDVSGTTSNPRLLPSKAALAGALGGTLIMPGVGTGLGAKAGEMIEGLFGKKSTGK